MDLSALAVIDELVNEMQKQQVIERIRPSGVGKWEGEDQGIGWFSLHPCLLFGA
jgi:hypothetical protein